MAGLDDAYELGGAAGEGRTTLVRLGVRRGDCRSVALKELRPEHALHTDRRARFVRQAHKATLLEHDAIERVLDVTEGHDGPVIVSEWIDGTSLHRVAAARRRAKRPWDPDLVAAVAHRLLGALRHAHHQPRTFEGEFTLHGGLNPRNVMIDARGNIKVVDFGMASIWQEAPEPWQDLEALRYLSADHLRSGPSPGSDLYAVGAIVHELLSGRRFRDECETEEEMRAAIASLELPDKPRTDIPTDLEHLRRRLLEPAQSPRLTLEHALDLCESLSAGSIRPRLRSMVRHVLRRASTSPPKRRSEDAVVVRARAEAQEHFIAGARLPTDSTPRLRQRGHERTADRPRRHDTRSVPIPIHREQTAARRPLFLDQTAPPQSEEARNAEQMRSGRVSRSSPIALTSVPIDSPSPASRHDGTVQPVLHSDTAPLPAETAAIWASRSPDIPPSLATPVDDDDEFHHDDYYDAIELDETAELERVPSISGLIPAARPRGTTELSPAVPAPVSAVSRGLGRHTGLVIAITSALALGIAGMLALRCNDGVEQRRP